MVLVFTTICLIILLGLLGWVTSNARLTQRHCQYTRSIAAAEAATEKVLTAISTDYKYQGQGYVLANLDTYRHMYPTSSENPAWADFSFMNLQGTADRTYVQYTPGNSFKVLSAQYQGLKGFANTFQIISNARDVNSAASVIGAVQQQIQLSTIPLFQFAMFYNLDYECNALPNITVTGPVHCNANIYLTPVNTLTFNSDVTATGTIYTTPKSGNGCGNPAGTIIFNGAHDSKVSTLSLPIGTNNSAAAVREVVEIPPGGEAANSSLGAQRYYNKADMVILVKDASVVVTSGLANNFSTVVPWLQATNFIRTNITFTNQREKKVIKAVEINIGNLSQWNATNTLISPSLPTGNIRTIYVADLRTMGTNQPGIRLVNGQTLLPQGLTVATPDPLYIQGHYNCPTANLSTTNTTGSLPASIAADAITVLSPSWNDANSTAAMSTRVAADTTVNAAFLAGIVETTTANGYSGGVENFPRFLEEWTNRTLTYNGSMVVMFQSKFATAPWVNIGIYYNPPIRNWAFDQNFSDPTGSKLPPATPSASTLVRGSWRVAQPRSTNTVVSL